MVQGQSSNDYSPQFSNDMEEIVFYSYRNGDGRIYTMNIDGSEQKELTGGEGNDIEPRWSPNDEYIIYSSTIDGIANVYKLDPKSKTVDQLTHFEKGFTGPVRWFANGKIYFRRDPNPDNSPQEELWVMDEDGSNQNKLMAFPKGQYGLDVGHKQEKVYFSAPNEEGKQDVYVSNIDGSSIVKLTEVAGNTGSLNVSPNGKQILFNANSTGNEEIYIMDKSGENIKRLTYTDQNEYFFAFSSDGKKIVFDSERNGAGDI